MHHLRILPVICQGPASLSLPHPSVCTCFLPPCGCYSLDEAPPQPHRGRSRNEKRLQPFLKTTAQQHTPLPASPPGMRNNCHRCFCLNSQEKQKGKTSTFPSRSEMQPRHEVLSLTPSLFQKPLSKNSYQEYALPHM